MSEEETDTEGLMNRIRQQAATSLSQKSELSSEKLVPNCNQIMRQFHAMCTEYFPQFLHTNAPQSRTVIAQTAEKYHHLMIEIMAGLTRRPSTNFDRQLADLRATMDNYSAAIAQYHNEEKIIQMKKQEEYLNNIQSMTRICGQYVKVEQAGCLPTIFDTQEEIDEHFEKASTILQGLEETLATRQKDVIQMMEDRQEHSRRVLNFFQAEALPDDVDVTARTLVFSSEETCNQQIELFSNWCVIHQVVKAMLQVANTCVVEALNTSTEEPTQKAANRWAREMQNYMSEVKTLTFKTRRNLKVAKEDMEDRAATLEKRRQRAQQMETVSLEVGAPNMLERDQQDLDKVRAAIESMTSKMELLESRLSDVMPTAEPVLELLGHETENLDADALHEILSQMGEGS